MQESNEHATQRLTSTEAPVNWLMYDIGTTSPSLNCASTAAMCTRKKTDVAGKYRAAE